MGGASVQSTPSIFWGFVQEKIQNCSCSPQPAFGQYAIVGKIQLLAAYYISKLFLGVMNYLSVW